MTASCSLSARIPNVAVSHKQECVIDEHFNISSEKKKPEFNCYRRTRQRIIISGSSRVKQHANWGVKIHAKGCWVRRKHSSTTRHTHRLMRRIRLMHRRPSTHYTVLHALQIRALCLCAQWRSQPLNSAVGHIALFNRNVIIYGRGGN